MPNQRIRTVLASLLWLIACSAAVHADFGNLTFMLPRSSNAIVLLNVEQALASPLAKEENWREGSEKAFAAGVSSFSPNTQQYALSARMDFDRMLPQWQIAALELGYEPQLARLAAQRGGTMDNIEGHTAVRFGSDYYVVQIGKRLVGTMSPAVRQDVANWVRRVSEPTRQQKLSPYLTEAIGFVTKAGTPIIMAIDLDQAVSPEAILERLRANRAVQAAGLDPEKVAQALASVRGATLGVTIGKRLFGSIKVDFHQDVSFLKGVGKTLLLEALARNGVAIEEFEEWEEVVQGKQILLKGRLYSSGLRRILSLVDPPLSLDTGSQTATASPGTDGNLATLASQQYFQSVKGLVDDLRKEKRRHSVKSFGQVGVWFGRYARKIDELPMVDVDATLLDYGAFVANSLRQGEAALRNVGGRSRVRELNQPAQYSYAGVAGGYYGSYGPGYAGGVVAWEDWRAEQHDRVRIQTEERVSGSASARQIMAEIDMATADVRRAMTEKYKVNF